TWALTDNLTDCAYPVRSTNLRIQKWDPFKKMWRAIRPDGGEFGLAVSLGVSPDGVLWAVNAGGNIYRFATNNIPVLMPGCARKVAVGVQENAWVLGCQWNNDKRGYPVYRWNTHLERWFLVPGYALDIAVAPDTGMPWIIDPQYRLEAWFGR